MDVLAKGNFRVVSFDQRGTGRSPHPADGDYSMASYISDLEAIRVDIGVERIHLLGHSFGGSYAIAYTATHPERVASLQLFASSGVRTADGDATEFERRIAAYEAKGSFVDGYDNFEGTQDCAAYFQTIWPVYLHDPGFPMSASLRATTCDVGTFMGTSKSNPDGWDFSAGVKAYTGPVAVYYGEADPFIAETQTIPKYFTSTAVAELELAECGHYWEECIDAVVPRVKKFLTKALESR
jgi:proline iminopeptidase